MKTEQEIRDWLKRHERDFTTGEWTDFGAGCHTGYVDALRWVLGTPKPLPIDPMEEWWQAWEKKRAQEWKDYLFYGKPIKIKGVMYTVKGTLDNEYWGARGV